MRSLSVATSKSAGKETGTSDTPMDLAERGPNTTGFKLDGAPRDQEQIRNQASSKTPTIQAPRGESRWMSRRVKGEEVRKSKVYQ